MVTNVTNGTVRRKQQIAFKRLMLGKFPSIQITEFIGLDFFKFKQWLAPKMLHEMNWNNYGDIWVVEHLIPLDYFDLLKQEECKLAWSYKNLIPVLSTDIYHIRYNFSFAFECIRKREQCAITEKLLAIAAKEIETLNEYAEWLIK